MDEKKFFQSADGIKLMYCRWEPAQQKRHTPVVLLHGASSNSSRWWYFVERSRLNKDRCLLRPDLRGHGESLWRGPAGIKHWMQDIAEMLHYEKIDGAIVVGHCLGANVALNFASRFPELCKGLVLVEPMVREAVSGDLARLRPLLPVFRFIVGLIRLFNRLGFYRRVLNSVNLRLLDRRVHEASGAELAQTLAKHGSPRHDIKVVPSAQYINNFIEIMRPLPVSDVHCPCLVIQSSGWRITNPVRTRIKLEELQTVEFVEVESEHWLPTLYPGQLCQLIDTWVLRH